MTIGSHSHQASTGGAFPANALQGAFRALADPTRRGILMHLTDRDMTIGEVTERFDITRAAVKKHLTVLEEGGLIAVEARGRSRINRLRPEGLKIAADWIAYFNRYWDDRLDALAAAIDKEGKDADD